MPGFDRTGPQGMGPRTGGGRGFCPPGTGPVYGYTEPVRGAGQGGIPWGGGRGRCWGGGRGRGWAGPYGYGVYGPYHAPDAGQEMDALKNQAASMEQELERIRKRIDALSGKKEEAE